MVETKSRHSKSELTTTVKLLITSVDCDPKAELPFSGHHHHRSPLVISRNDIVDALDSAKYSFATRRLTDLLPSQNTTTAPRIKVAFLGLQAAKKVAFFYDDDDYTGTSLYQITYDESLMNDLPSHVNIKGLPRFHLFSYMPVDLQWAVAEQLDGVGFARMRCVNRDLRRMWWNPRLNIVYKYSHPDMSNNKHRAAGMSSNSGGNGFLHLASRVCSVAMVLYLIYKARSADKYVYCKDEDDNEL